MRDFTIARVIPPPLSLSSAIIPVSGNELPLNEDFAAVVDLSQRLRSICICIQDLGDSIKTLVNSGNLTIVDNQVPQRRR